MKYDQLEKRYDELTTILKNRYNEKGYWEGRLSSSALGVAVAIAALHFHNESKHQQAIAKGLSWLKRNINQDGSFGDTPESKGNVSTSLLVFAAVNLYAKNDADLASLQHKIAAYLKCQAIDISTGQVTKAILQHYQKDYTFSVPILTMCGLCGIPGPEAFRAIPQLPFELALVPRRFYHLLNLSVVSYAIPALIAVGIVVYKKKPSNMLSRMGREWAIRPALNLLRRLMPASGGFLEAMPLTAFVCLSLVEAGYADEEVVEQGIQFLCRTQREDGSWPIDIDLSTWVTSLSVKSLRSNVKEVFAEEEQEAIVGHFKRIQNKEIHPFNGSRPGGWGWTNFSGSVPDGDDTPGAVLALLRLQDKEKVQAEVLAAAEWLVQLQNRDGGMPTFSKGWGKLPFDQSCADLTGHALLAVSTCIEIYGDVLSTQAAKKNKRFCQRALQYLRKHQREDGSWLPLWFGNQQVDGHANPVYGTARVITYLKDMSQHEWLKEDERLRLEQLMHSGSYYLGGAQNEDGSWGGQKGCPGSLEETALAVAALAGSEWRLHVKRGVEWMDSCYQQQGLKASPIGLYFASLWYDEQMYPLTAYLEALSRLLELRNQLSV